MELCYRAVNDSSLHFGVCQSAGSCLEIMQWFIGTEPMLSILNSSCAILL
jgi:hypothetical protein